MAATLFFDGKNAFLNQDFVKIFVTY